MPKLFKEKDLEQKPEEKTEEKSSSSEPLFSVDDAGTWSMKFDKETTDDLDKLKQYIPKAKSRQDVVFTALEILALAVNRDVLIKGKHDGVSKQVEGLWD